MTDDDTSDDPPQEWHAGLTEDTTFGSGWTLYVNDPNADDQQWYIAQQERDATWRYITPDGNEEHHGQRVDRSDIPVYDSSGKAQLAHRQWLNNDDRNRTKLGDHDATPPSPVESDTHDADDEDTSNSSNLRGMRSSSEDGTDEEDTNEDNTAETQTRDASSDDSRRASDPTNSDSNTDKRTGADVLGARTSSNDDSEPDSKESATDDDESDKRTGADVLGVGKDTETDDKRTGADAIDDYEYDGEDNADDTDGGSGVGDALRGLSPFGKGSEDEERDGEDSEKKWWEFGNDARLGDAFRGQAPDSDEEDEDDESSRRIPEGEGEFKVEHGPEESSPGDREVHGDGVEDIKYDSKQDVDGDGVADTTRREAMEQRNRDDATETVGERANDPGEEASPTKTAPDASERDGKRAEAIEESTGPAARVSNSVSGAVESVRSSLPAALGGTSDGQADDNPVDSTTPEADPADTTAASTGDHAASNPVPTAAETSAEESTTDGRSRSESGFSASNFLESAGIEERNEDLASFDWGEELGTAKEKVSRAQSGDSHATYDVKDAPRRILNKFRLDPDAREDLVDATLPFSLAASGFLFLLALALLDPRSEMSQLFTMPTRYADVFVISTALMVISAVGFWLGRKNIGSGSDSIRRASRVVLIVLQLIPLGLVAVVVGSLVLDGADTFVAFENAWINFKASAGGALPDLGLSDWYYDNSPFGFTIRDTGIMMLFVGLVSGTPFAVRTLKELILAFNDDPPTRETERDDYGRNGGGSGDGGGGDPVIGPSGGGGVSFSAGGEVDGYELADASAAMLALPDEMRNSPYEGYEEHERYWVRAPYAYVSIVYNPDQNDYRMVVVEPDLDDTEVALIEEFDERLGTALLFEDIDENTEDDREAAKVERLEQKVLELAAEYNIDVEDETFHKILYYLERNYIYYNKIDPFMNDPNVEDISCDGDDTYIFVYHREYNDLMTNVKFTRDQLRSFIVQLAQRSGEHISAADPMCDASLPDGSRAQMTLGSEVTTHGSTFTIRLFKEIPFTPVDLLHYGTFDVNQMAYLWLAIEHDKSLIFAGGTASGKTTSMNAVSLFIPPKAKVVTLEDTREIKLPHDNWIPGTTRDSVGAAGGESIEMYNLLEAALRQRPEYLIVGEIRGEEAETLFQAMSTGHTTYSTMHADSVERAIGRLENPPINVPRAMIDSLDIMCIQQQVRLYDEEEKKVKNVRRNMMTTEIIGMRKDDSFITHRPYRRDAERDAFIEQLDDSHVLDDIREEQGWTQEELEENLQERKDILMYLVNNEIRDFEAVARTIQAYMVDSKTVVEKVENDTLEPKSFEDITEVNLETDLAGPEETLNDITTEDLGTAESDKKGGAGDAR